MKNKSGKPLVIAKIEFKSNADAATRLRRVLELLLSSPNPNKKPERNGEENDGNG